MESVVVADRVVRRGMGLTRKRHSPAPGDAAPLALYTYVGALSVVLAVILGVAARTSGSPAELLPLAVLTVLFALTELTDLTFHGRGGDWGLSASEAVLLPMVVVLPFGYVVWAVAIAIAAVRLYRWKAGVVKGIFNVAQYGVGAAAAAGIWAVAADPAASLTFRNACVAIAAVLAFTVLTHGFVAVAIAVARHASFANVLGGVGVAAAINIAGGLVLGLLFGSSILSSRWTVLLFPLPLLGLYLGYRAVLRQREETDRLRHLHSASRALASSPDLDAALLGFLGAVRDIASARETRVVLKTGQETVWSGVDGDSALARLEPLTVGGLSMLLMEIERTEAPLLLCEGSERDDLLSGLGARSLVAVPLEDAEGVLGCLVAIDRVGAGEFGEPESLLLGAVAGELIAILDAHRLHAAVTEERQRFGRIFHGSGEGIALLDRRGVVRAWNPALERITGYAAAEVMGRPWSDRVVLRHDDQRRLTSDELFSSNGRDIEVLTKDGPGRWISIAASAINSSDGGSADRAWVLLVRDVTAAHEAEEAKSDFLSTISHELRTPLTSIKGALQVLARGSDVSPDLSDQMVTVMQRGSDRLERLVMNLLVVSQIESGRLSELQTEEVSIGGMVRNAAARTLAGHRVDLLESPGSLLVRADAERLMQVVEHVLDNAAKFGGPDGLVTVSIGQDRGFGRVSVTDQGPGIPTADHERIFDRFVRLGHVLTRTTQGAGVGLFIAKRALEVMGGSIWVESEPGRGTTFHIEVPLARPVAIARPA